jgi:uracil-DNA glycosylase
LEFQSQFLKKAHVSLPSLSDQLHPQWKQVLQESLVLLDEIDRDLPAQTFPTRHLILRALSQPLDSARVVIIGQDPYPTPGDAVGLSFSVSKEQKRIPASLKNIFKELSDDLGQLIPAHGDLTSWSDQGVVLLNRALTYDPDNKRVDSRWIPFTNEVARILGERNVVAILWGASAQELTPYFKSELTISSVHPSPLSAYRGFFGSKPFSRANDLLRKHGKEEIRW